MREPIAADCPSVFLSVQEAIVYVFHWIPLLKPLQLRVCWKHQNSLNAAAEEDWQSRSSGTLYIVFVDTKQVMKFQKQIRKPLHCSIKTNYWYYFEDIIDTHTDTNTHSLTHTHTHSLTHSLTHSHTHSLTQAHTHTHSTHYHMLTLHANQKHKGK